MVRLQLDALTAQMSEVHQQSSSIAMNAAVSGLAGTVSKPHPEDMRVGRPDPYALGKDFDGHTGTLDPAHPAVAETNSGHHTNSSLQHCSREKLETTFSKLADNCAWRNDNTVESMDTKHLIVGSSRRTNLKVKARAQESRNPRRQKSVRVTTVNMSMIGIQVHTLPHSSQIFLK